MQYPSDRAVDDCLTALANRYPFVAKPGIALFDMDGTLLRDRSVLELARRNGRIDQVLKYLDNPECTSAERTQLISESLSGIPSSEFKEVAWTMPLNDGAEETVAALRRQGYCVGIVSDGYQIVADTLRQRVAADFSVGTILHFRNGRSAGELSHSRLLRHPRGCQQHPICKRNLLIHLRKQTGNSALRVVAVGDGINDACLLRDACLGIAFEPKLESVRAAAAHVISGDLRKVLDLCHQMGEAPDRAEFSL